MKTLKMWQWMDNHFGPMGWFSDEEKEEMKNHPDLQNGTWKKVSEEEKEDFNRWIGRLAYEQS